MRQHSRQCVTNLSLLSLTQSAFVSIALKRALAPNRYVCYVCLRLISADSFCSFSQIPFMDCLNTDLVLQVGYDLYHWKTSRLESQRDQIWRCQSWLQMSRNTALNHVWTHLSTFKSYCKPTFTPYKCLANLHDFLKLH